MKRLNVGNATEANVKTALETLGFVQDTTNTDRYYWGENHNNNAAYISLINSTSTLSNGIIFNIYFATNTSVKGYLHKSSNTATADSNITFMYEYLDGGGIALGVDTYTITNPRIELIIKKVKDSNNNDKFVTICNTTHQSGSSGFYFSPINMLVNNSTTYAFGAYYLGSNYLADSDSLQYTKFFNRYFNEFYDGIYVVQVSPVIYGIYNTSSEHSNIKTVVIDDKSYLLVCFVHVGSSQAASSSRYVQKIMVPVAQSSE